jgi:hypothetical protein
MGMPKAEASRMEIMKTPQAPRVLRAESQAVYFRRICGADKNLL